MNKRLATAWCVVFGSACGGASIGSQDDAGANIDGAAGTIDASTATIDATVIDAAPPDVVTTDASAECVIADASAAPEVGLLNGTVVPAGQGGTLVSDDWVLDEALIDAPIDVTGTVQGVIDIRGASGTTGALAVDAIGVITSPIDANLDINGDSYYTSADETVTFSMHPACDAPPPITSAEFTATPTELTVWTVFDVDGLDVPARLHFTNK